MDPIYLDYNATTPVDPAVADAMRPYIDSHFGNPSSTHTYGRRARQALETAREQMAALLGARPEEIVFTSGGTESNNLAICGVAGDATDHQNHIITSAVEHPAVSEVCANLERLGYDVTRLPVDADGRISVDDVARAIKPSTVLITIMHANNEVGTVQPIREIARIARDRGIRIHTDAAQTVGKIPANVNDLGVDLLSVAGHKFYGPKGVGALYVRSGVRLRKLMHGAGHEQGRRPGTENVAGIVGLGAAAQIASRELYQRAAHAQSLRDRLHHRLAERIPDAHLNGHPERRLPNTLSLSFPGLDAGALLSAVPEVAASPGAACHSDGVRLSPTLQAMNLPPNLARGTIRLSTGSFLTEENVDRAAKTIVNAVNRLRERRP